MRALARFPRFSEFAAMSLQSFFSFVTFRKARTHQERWEQLLLRESFRYGLEMYWQLTKVFGIAWVQNCVVFWLFAMVMMQLLSPAPWHWPSAGQFKMLWFVASAAFVFAFPISVVVSYVAKIIWLPAIFLNPVAHLAFMRLDDISILALVRQFRGAVRVRAMDALIREIKSGEMPFVDEHGNPIR